MTATIDWTIQQLDRKTADGFVTTAHWRCDATDGEYSTGVYGTTGWQETTENALIPYESLTQEQVLGWLWDSLDKAETEANVLAQIEAQKSPVVMPGVPWK